ncbi:MAG TPA: plastocyanin/azurin family copper-binding protein [Solirubrobacterales bacterium]|nr:plastocyanin/azurin family copper-binding protein [Solirubrobacterales bacterium]
MRRRGRTLLRLAAFTATALLAAALAVPAAATATNTRVSIAYYKWSNREVHIDLGEKVTWDWLGPDLAHSVTGISAGATQWDSDPHTDAPFHRPGYSYTLQFNQPGTYVFQCKLHPVVRGQVIVSDVPGDPNSDPGPQAPLNVDVTRPVLSKVKLGARVAHGAVGVPLSLRLSKKGRLEAQYYRLAGGRRSYAGYAAWKLRAGTNRLRLGARWKHFEARTGRYEAVLRATDPAANESRSVTLRFSIAG